MIYQNQSGDIQMNLGKSLKIVLAKEDKSQKWLAEQMGTSNAMVCKWCNKKTYSWETVFSICALFDYKVSEFIALGED